MSALAPLLAAVGANGEALVRPHLVYESLLPELVLGGGAVLLVLMGALFTERVPAKVAGLLTVAFSLVSMGCVVPAWRSLKDTGARSVFAGAIADDHFSLFFVVAIAIATLLSALASIDWLERRGKDGVELFALMMLAATGGMLMAAANDLIVIFLGLEILSISLYVLVGFARGGERSREAAMKYFVLGSFASAIFLYGIALVYGAIGTTSLSGIAQFLSQNLVVDRGILLAGVVMLAVGFAFKIAAAPFHQWTPDVYHGAPTPVTGFMAAAAKAAAFAALLRVFASTLFTMRLDWQPVVLVLAVLTLLVGSVIACVQQNVKRMLAYSSVSHAGYILLGLQAASTDGVSAALYYLLAYTFMAVGSFAIVAVVGGQAENDRGIEAFRGLGYRRPVLGLAFTVLLVAQAGIPLTSGFLAKFYVISSLVQNGSYGTAVFAMVLAAVAAYFYLRLVVTMYGSHPQERAMVEVEDGTAAVGPASATDDLGVRWPTGVLLAVAVVATVGLGIAPPQVIDAVKLARDATADLF